MLFRSHYNTAQNITYITIQSTIYKVNLLAYLDLQYLLYKRKKNRHLSYFLLTVHDRFRDTAGKKEKIVKSEKKLCEKICDLGKSAFLYLPL